MNFVLGRLIAAAPLPVTVRAPTALAVPAVTFNFPSPERFTADCCSAATLTVAPPAPEPLIPPTLSVPVPVSDPSWAVPPVTLSVAMLLVDPAVTLPPVMSA
jgi:hypothetical protein